MRGEAGRLARWGDSGRAPCLDYVQQAGHEKCAWRSICAERVVSVTPVRARIATRPAAPAARVAAIVTDDDFGGGFVSTRAHAATRRARV